MRNLVLILTVALALPPLSPLAVASTVSVPHTDRGQGHGQGEGKVIRIVIIRPRPEPPPSLWDTVRADSDSDPDPGLDPAYYEANPWWEVWPDDDLMPDFD
ncbi:MAG: hypothetical protein JRI66_11255 [Deltaproteobacteria bacterium]|nr:hypothetical protein [Deltaproteobacteria bacterium]